MEEDPTPCSNPDCPEDVVKHGTYGDVDIQIAEERMQSDPDAGKYSYELCPDCAVNVLKAIKQLK